MYGYVWICMVWWYGMVWYGMIWYGMVWYGMVWYGKEWYRMYSIYIYIYVWTCMVCTVCYLLLSLSILWLCFSVLMYAGICSFLSAPTCTCTSISNFLPVSLRLFQFLFIHLAWFICRYGPCLLDTGSALLQCLVTRIIHTLHRLWASHCRSTTGHGTAWDKIQVLLKSKRTTVEQWWKQVYPLFPQQNL